MSLYVRAAPIALGGYVGGIVLRRTMVSPAVFRIVVLVLFTVYGLVLLARVFSE